MGKVVAGATVSLDGYIAAPIESGLEHLFAWFDGGNHGLPSLNPDLQFRLTEADYRYTGGSVRRPAEVNPSPIRPPQPPRGSTRTASVRTPASVAS